MFPTPTNVLDQIFQGIDPIQIFLNAYTFCATKEEAAFDLFRDDGFDTSYQEKAKELETMLKAGTPLPKLRQQLGGNDERETLAHILGLVSALARNINETQQTKLTKSIEPYYNSRGYPYWLGLNRPPLGGRIPNLRRRPSELHWKFVDCHEPLSVAPGRLKEGEWKLTRIKLDESLEYFLRRRLENGGFRIAASPLSYQADIQGKSRHRPQHTPPYAFHLTSIEPVQEQIATLNAVLESARNEGVSLLVLPELRMQPELLEAAKIFLRKQIIDEKCGLLVVVAGSWHIEEEKRRVNRSVVLNHRGEELWAHDKLREYVITAANFDENPDFYRPLGIEEGGGEEDIHRGTKLEFYDSSIGRLAVAICVGFFSSDIEDLLRSSAANVFLVPAMSPSTSEMELVAKDLTRTQTAVTFVAACGYIGTVAAKSSKALCFYQLPAKGLGPEKLKDNGKLLFYTLP